MTVRGRPKDDAARERIVKVATDLFIQNGFGATTMGAIAQRADVAVKTLYAAYGGKQGILEAVHFRAVRGIDGGTRLIDQDWVGELADAESVTEAWERVSVRQLESANRVAPIIGVMNDAACEPVVSSLLNELKASRYVFWTGIAQILAEIPGVHPSLDIERLADVMNNVRSAECYIMFVYERGWDEEQWRRWTDDLILREITGN